MGSFGFYTAQGNLCRVEQGLKCSLPCCGAAATWAPCNFYKGVVCAKDYTDSK